MSETQNSYGVTISAFTLFLFLFLHCNIVAVSLHLRLITFVRTYVEVNIFVLNLPCEQNE